MVQQKPEFDPCSPVHVKKGLRLLATTDLHMHLTGYDYRTNRPSHATGLTRIATLIREARAQAETEGRSVLLFDNGDTFQGTPLGDPEVLPENAPHPLIRAFDFLGYDAMGLGNHDFDFGLAPLDRALADASCPVISSNLERCDPGAEPPTVPFAILDRILVTANGPKGIRIGVLSFLPPQTTKWDADILSGRVRVHDIVTTARNRVAELKRLGCDLIVALGHTGIEEASSPETAENVGVALAGIAGIDALIAGHTHLVLPGKAHEGISHVDAEKGLIHGTPVIMPGANGSHLGVIDLELDWSPTQGWRVTGTTSESRPVALPDAQATVPEDPDLLNLLAPYHRTAVAHLDAPVGSIDLALHSYFSMLGPDPVMRFVAGAQAAALTPLIEASEARGLPLLSVAAPGRFGGRSGPANFTEIEAGPLTRRHLSDILPFPNQLTALIVTGRTITEWLDASARAFRLIGPGSRGQALVNPDFPGHDFDVLFGLTYRFDLTRQKAIDVRWNGRRLDPEEQFAVAVNSFRARGGGHHGVLDAAREIRLPPISLHRVLAAWIAGTLPPDPLADQPYPWSFERIGGTTVTARTGKGATRYLADLPNLNAVSSGAKADGFVQVELKL